MHDDTDPNAALDDLRFQMGPEAGNLAFAHDLLTDAMRAIAQHKVYCRVEKGPRAGEGSLDIEHLLTELQRCKGLVRDTMQSLDERRR